MKELPQPEWDFRSCPKQELDLCLVYELAREQPEIIELAAKRRAQSKEHSFRAYVEIAPEAVGGRFGNAFFYFYFPEWPKRPYLTISPKERKERLRLLNPIGPAIEEKIRARPYVLGSPAALRLNLEYDPKSEFVRDLFDRPYSEYLLIQMPWWRFSNEELVRAFASALKKLRPTQFGNYRNAGAGSAQRKSGKALKRLGAHRLFKYHGFPDCRDVAFLYRDHSAWIKSSKKIEAMISGLPLPVFLAVR